MILHRYFARRFLLSFAAIFALFLALLSLVDVVEQLREFGGEGVPFRDILQLAVLNVPRALYQILPLLVIITTVTLFLSLARSSEMVVTRAAGRSALRALWAPGIAAFLIGLVAIGVFNPIVAGTSKAYEARVSQIETGGANTLLIAQDALWLRQGGADGQTVIRAAGASLDGTDLRDVTFITFAPEGGPRERIEAESARLTGGAWELEGVKLWPLTNTPNPEVAALEKPTHRVPSDLTADQIRDSFGTPSSIPIWELPRFISQLTDAGFSARRHAMWLQQELSLPTFLVAMVLIGAGFTMRHQRGGRTGIMVLTAIVLAFTLYFIRNFASVLGENGDLPIMLAAWGPPLAAIALSLGLLLHLEDG